MSGLDWSSLDWGGLALGAGLGLAASALYFLGLAWGIRRALGGPRAAPLLLASSALRIALLLALGWWVAGQGAAALAGFALAFVAARFAAIAAARRPDAGRTAKEAAPWN